MANKKEAVSQNRSFDLKFMLAAWTDAITKPSVETFERISSHPNASARRAYDWIVFSFLLILVLVLVLGGPFGSTFGFAIQTILGLTIYTALTQLFAKSLGGEGSFSKLLYAYSAFYSPLLLVMVVLVFLPFADVLTTLISVYMAGLSVIAVKAVNNFSWWKAFVSAATLVFLAILTVVGLTLFGSAIGGLFANISFPL